MDVSFRYGRDEINVAVPADSLIYESHFPPAAAPPGRTVLEAVRNPLGASALRGALQNRRAGEVVIVVSDITRPIPYASFLPQLLQEVEDAGVPREDILVLVATGMHRPCTAEEFREMFGPVPPVYRVLNHNPRDPEELVELQQRTWAGSQVKVNRHFVEAGFRMTTGLVEPHFMAGFSGGRKSVCPGIAGLETIRHFHGHEFMGSPQVRNKHLHDNPCHEEALSVARAVGVDFSLDVVLNNDRELVRAFAGDLEDAHRAACAFAAECTCRTVQQEADVLVTSSGGYPLDATFYQCVKGFVSGLPAVRPGGAIIDFGSCSEGIGSQEYTALMKRYSGRWRQFLQDIANPGVFTKDQWQFQMHCRALDKVGQENLHFVSTGLDAQELQQMSVHAHAVQPGEVQDCVQKLVNELLKGGGRLAVLPEGPYCAPVRPENATDNGEVPG